MPSKKGKKEEKKEVVKKQPQAGKIEKASSKKDKGPQKGVEKVAKIVDKKATQSVSKDKKSGSKSVSKKDSKKDSKKKKEPTPSSSSEDESMESASSSGSESGSGSSSSGSGSSSSGSSSSGSGSSSSGSEDVEVEAEATPVTPAKGKAQAAPAESSIDGITTVFIGNLKFTITDEDVHKFFADCGTITEIAWSEGDDGRFAGRGIITFSKPSEAAKAAEKNGQMLLDRALRCNLEIPRALRGQGSGNFGEPSTTLVLKGLAYKATTDDVRRAFSSVSTDIDVRIPAKGGVAFVEFADLETSKKAIELADGLSIAGRNIVPEYAKPRDGGPSTPRTPREGGFQRGGFQRGGNTGGGFKTPKPDGGCTFFMGGLPPSVEESDVRNAFAGCNIANIRWVERDGVFKGVAFVEFADTTTADKAFQKAQGGVHIKGRDARLDWAADSNKKKF